MSETPETNPYEPPVTVDFGTPPREKRFTHSSLLGLMIVQAAVIAGGWAFMFVEITSIIYSGAVVTAIGAILCGMAYRRADYNLARFAISTPIFAVFLLILINLLRWSPDDARTPVQFMGSIYGSCATLWAISLFMRRN